MLDREPSMSETAGAGADADHQLPPRGVSAPAAHRPASCSASSPRHGLPHAVCLTHCQVLLLSFLAMALPRTLSSLPPASCSPSAAQFAIFYVVVTLFYSPPWVTFSIPVSTMSWAAWANPGKVSRGCFFPPQEFLRLAMHGNVAGARRSPMEVRWELRDAPA